MYHPHGDERVQIGDGYEWACFVVHPKDARTSCGFLIGISLIMRNAFFDIDPGTYIPRMHDAMGKISTVGIGTAGIFP